MNEQNKQTKAPFVFHNPLSHALKSVFVKGHGEVKIKSPQHLREVLLSATK